MTSTLALLFVFLRVGFAQTAEQTEFFEKQVRPILVNNCVSCHGGKSGVAFAGLRLDTRDGAFKGSDSGPVIFPGHAAQSKLMRAVRGELPKRMPPSGSLKDSQIQVLATWIETGAVWPTDGVQPVAGFDVGERKRQHWAWQPVQKVTLPKVRNEQWPLQPVDRFILAQLEARGMRPAPPATRSAWLRRVTFDLTGLPPSIEESVEFEAGNSPADFGNVVDRLLASPRFGERFARRWMDLVRYTESHGSEGDPDIPMAWRYRDYLIRAFNADVAYDQLVREQIAGDMLSSPRINAKEHINESVIGLAQFRMVEHGFQPVDPWEDRVKWIDNQIDVLSKTFQGLTVSCARCHNHKFDAISQKDYYALFGILASGRPTQRAMDDPAFLNRNKEKLSELKSRIKTGLAAAWMAAAEPAAKRLVEDNPWFTPNAGFETAAAYWRNESAARRAFNAKNFTTVWDVHTDGFADWLRHGTGVAQKPTPAGEFAVEFEGAKVTGGIYPSGLYSHLISSKHNAVISSPRFKIDTDSISLRMSGAASFAQLIIENYAVPRGGIYNQIASPKEDRMGWTRWDTRFWKGFTGYIEFATFEDVTNTQAKPPKFDGRSWFGAQKIVFHNNALVPKEDMLPAVAMMIGAQGTEAETIRAAVAAWRDGGLTEEQAALLDYMVRRGMLPNSMNALDALRPLVDQYRTLEKEVPAARRVPGLLEEGGADQPMLIRGGLKSPGAPAARCFLSALNSKPYGDPRTMRLRLAEEIASPQNPLTSRVMVNRIWQSMFRRGIVRTVDNFGKLGDAPTHPELLDWLATRFIEDGWSIKKTIRMLAASRTYRMSASGGEPGGGLQHMPVRRLEAEEIRDAMLAISGQLDLNMYGPSIPTYYSHDTGKTKGDRPKGPLDGAGRRSVYVEVRRNAVNPLLEVFDAPRPASTRGERDVTNVPAQSLALMNSPFVIDQAAKWAKRADSLDQMFLRALGRKPTAAERDEAQSYLSGATMEGLAQAIFNMKEFLYVR